MFDNDIPSGGNIRTKVGGRVLYEYDTSFSFSITSDIQITETRWAKGDPNCVHVIKESWKLNSTSSSNVNWFNNLGRCSRALSRWAKGTFPNFAKSVCLEISTVEAALDIENEEVHDGIAGATNKIHEYWALEELYWKQRSRTFWLSHGDQNTRFFHQSTIMNRRRNKILRIKDRAGSWVSSEKEVVKVLHDHFSDSYKATPHSDMETVIDFVDHLVTDDMNSMLSAVISMEEIKSAVFSLGANKSPGPDGFSGFFYQHYWEVVNALVFDATSDSFGSKFVFSSFNHTHIALIPKVECPESPSQYRPISLCNFAYKILAKVIANRLRSIMPSLITENQSAFVEGRQIQDNIIVAHECFHHLKLLKGGKDEELALKLDMNKAYDCVNWSFLESVLLKMGFDGRWVHLIMSCVSTVSMAVIVNGSPGKKFKPSRGLRQGDPLSPFLFLFVNDVLSRMIRKLGEENLLDVLQLANGGPKISHLFFADDSLFFLKANLSNCEALSDTLEVYCKASGQSINMQKSSLYFSPNTRPEIVLLLSRVLGMSAVSNPGKYLGLPTIWGKSKISALKYVKEKIVKKISGWCQSTLSQAGKEILIKSVASAVPTYPMSIFKFPATTCKDINSSLAKFWWGNGESAGIHWKKWDDLGLDKSMGGLGFRNMEDFNAALLAKQGWRILANPEALWVRVLKNKYFRNCSFLDASVGSSPSWVWSSLLHGRTLLNKGLCWQVGNGLSVDIWRDNWIPSYSSMNLKSFSPTNVGPCAVASIINHESEVWKLDDLVNLIPVDVLSAIQATTFGPLTVQDKLIWIPANLGIYSVKSGYKLAVNSRGDVHRLHQHHSISIPSSFWKFLWKMKIPPRIKFFLWRILSNILPTNLIRFRRHMASTALCPICEQFDESVEHAIFLCPWTQKVWFAHPFSYKVDLQAFTSFFDWLNAQISSMKEGVKLGNEFITHMIFLIWFIWKQRCKFIFDGVVLDPIRVASLAFSGAEEFLATPSLLRSPNHVSMPPHGDDTLNWSAPEQGMLKLNTDAAWDASTLECGLAALVRNSKGDLIGGLMAKSVASSALAAEAMAIQLGLKLATSMSISSFSLESDCLVLISSLLNPLSLVDWSASHLISSIRLKVASFERIFWRWASRRANSAADLVASWSLNGVCPQDWFSNPPTSLLRILLFDAAAPPP